VNQFLQEIIFPIGKDVKKMELLHRCSKKKAIGKGQPAKWEKSNRQPATLCLPITCCHFAGCPWLFCRLP